VKGTGYFSPEKLPVAFFLLMLKSKTSVTKALLKERAKNKKREDGKLT